MGVRLGMGVKVGIGVMEGKGVLVIVGVLAVVKVKVGAAVRVWTKPVSTRSGVELGVSEAGGADSIGLHAEIASTTVTVIHREVLILVCTV
jgi:hypothetical protein